jgi:hypothetical protein
MILISEYTAAETGSVLRHGKMSSDNAQKNRSTLPLQSIVNEMPTHVYNALCREVRRLADCVAACQHLKNRIHQRIVPSRVCMNMF